MSAKRTTKETMNQTNGLDMEALVGTIAAVKQDPTLGAFEFRATNQWINGGKNRSRIKEFPPGLKIHIHHLTILINRPPQIVLLAVDLHEYFIDQEGIAIAPMHSLQYSSV